MEKKYRLSYVSNNNKLLYRYAARTCSGDSEVLVFYEEILLWKEFVQKQK